MLFDSLDKIKRNAIFSAILLASLGAVILICPAAYIPTMIMGFGYSLVILALVLMLDFFTSKKSLMDYLKFVGALIVCVVGICVLLFQERNILRVMAWLFGAMLVLDGFRTMLHSFRFARKAHRKAWWVLTILSVFLMIAGVMLFVNPWFGEPEALKKVIGAVILFAAIVSVLRLIWTWPIRKQKGGKENG